MYKARTEDRICQRCFGLSLRKNATRAGSEEGRPFSQAILAFAF